MATITVDTFLDDGTARTAGEAHIVNSGRLTVRTDTRWHIGAPASMTGSLGGILTLSSISSSFHIDGTKVRWLAYDTGSGNVPAINTTVTQGGVTGTLLGVWASLTAAPTAVGAAMPATGFLKFREVTGGPYSAGALTGIAASATSADVVGWIEVVMDHSGYIDQSYASPGVSSEGNWFQLGTTNGTVGQVIQIPTNGGGAGTLCPGFQIETSVGSNIYEWYPGVPTASFLTTAISTGSEAKVVRIGTDGQAIIGQTSTATSCGFTPVSGLRIRIPNIFLRQCAAASRSVNALASTPNTRPKFTNGSNGSYTNLKHVTSDWYNSFGTFKSFKFTDSIIDYPGLTTLAYENCEYNNVCISSLNNSGSLTYGSFAENLTFNNFVIGAVSPGLSINRAKTVYINSCKEIMVARTNSSPFAFVLTNLDNLYVNGLQSIGTHTLDLTNVLFADIKNLDFTSSIFGISSSTTGATARIINIATCGTVLVDGVTVGNNGEWPQRNPFSGVYQINGVTTKVDFRNMGTLTVPIGSAASSGPNYLMHPNNSKTNNILTKRVYFQEIRSTIYNGQSSVLQNNTAMVNVGWGYANTKAAAATTDAVFKGCQGTLIAAGAARGLMFFDGFTSTTTGYIGSNIADITLKSAAYQTIVSANPSIPTAYYSLNGANLVAVGDNIIVESDYFVLGHTGFQNTTPTVSGSGTLTNHSITYQIDTGAGWNGAWKNLTGANLSAETISPSKGVKLKFKITCTVASSSNWINDVKVFTTSTLAAQSSNLYPLDQVTQSFTGLIPGSEVRCYAGTDPATAVEIGGIESTAGSTFSFTHSSAGVAGTIAIFALGYQPIYLPFTYTSVDNSVLIQPVIDRNYVNPV